MKNILLRIAKIFVACGLDLSELNQSSSAEMRRNNEKFVDKANKLLYNIYIS